jgi:hypothetical protein
MVQMSEQGCSIYKWTSGDAQLVFPGKTNLEIMLLRKKLEWRPSGRRKGDRPKVTWAEWIRGTMAEKGLQEEDWTDRNNWRRKIA